MREASSSTGALCSPVGAALLDGHDDCLRYPERGWRVCLTSWHAGLAVAATSADRVRVVVCEPSSRGRHHGLARHVRLAAGRLLATGFDVEDSVDPLRVLLARRCGLHRPGPALVVLDLFRSGAIEVARRNAPSLRHLSASGGMRVTVDRDQAVPKVPADGWVLALSPAFARLMPAEISSEAAAATDPCELREQLVLHNMGGVVRRLGQAPPLAIAERVEA